MKLKDIDVTKTIEEAKLFIESDKTLSPAARSIINLLIVVIQIFIGKMSLNSKNSSTPPSQDKNREKNLKKPSGKKPGGQEVRRSGGQEVRSSELARILCKQRLQMK